jgi:hypothetical protein
VPLATWIDFSGPSTVDRLGGPGWSYSDVDGTWTDGTEARVVLPVAVDGEAELVVTLDLVPYLVAASSQRRVEVRADDRTVARLNFDGRTYVRAPVVVRVARRHGHDSEPLELAFVIHRPQVPATLGLSSDARRVGLKLRRLRIDRSP